MNERTVVRDAHTSDAQEGAYKTEHAVAWVLVFTSLVLGAIGVLRGFGLVGSDPVEVGEPGSQAFGFGAIWDSAAWLLAAIAFGFLANALHRNDHHRSRDPELAPDSEEGMWKTEHAAAYLTALGTIVMAVLGILVSFDVFDRGYDQPDGLPWLLASIGTGVLTVALHGVRHHQLADEEYIARVVDRRAMHIDAGSTRPATTTHSATTFETEHRP